MPKQKHKNLLNESVGLPEASLDNEIPIVTVGDGFVKFTPEENFASLTSRILARIIDLILVLFIFIILSGFASTFVLSFAPSKSKDYLLQKFSNNDISLDQAENLLSCNVEESDKDICNQTLPYLAWVNASNIILLMFIHLLYFSILSKLKYNTIGKKFLKIKVSSNARNNISWLQSFARECIWMFIFIFLAMSYFFPIFSNLVLIFFWVQIVSLIIILTKPTKTGVHDIIAQTIVIKN